MTGMCSLLPPACCSKLLLPRRHEATGAGIAWREAHLRYVAIQRHASECDRNAPGRQARLGALAYYTWNGTSK